MAAQVLPSVCPLDCPDTCSFDVTVAEEQVVRVRGSHANPYTDASICAKVTRYPEWVHGPNRLRHPLRRTGAKGEGRFERVSWKQALDLVHDRFQAIIERHGPQAIAPLNYAGPHGMLAGGSMDLRFFYRLGATRLARRPMCGGVRDAAFRGTFGAVPLMRPEHVAHARLIVVWGCNVTVSQLHLRPMIAAARRAGARLVVIDPLRTPIARKADLHLALLPGTDVVLGLALAAELERIGGMDRDFVARHVAGADAYLEAARPWTVARAAEVCGLEPGEIRRLAEWYRDASPAVIVPGNGPERNRNGGSGLRAAFALPALAGKFGVPGGGLCLGASAAFPKTPARLQGEHLCPPGTRTLNLVRMGEHLTDPDLAPPIEGLFVYNHNALIVHPDQNTMRRALARADLFTVVCDVVMTDTARYADVVLPACSHFEYADLYPAYGQHYLQRAEAVIPPVGEALPNTEIFRRLARRFSFTDPELRASDRELMDDAVDAADPRMQGLPGSGLPLGEGLPMRFDGADATLLRTTFPRTPSGRIELESTLLAEEYGRPLPTYEPVRSRFPLALLTPASDQRTTSTFGELSPSDAVWLEMHPDDARARGLPDGARVRVFNELGEVRLALRVSTQVRPGVVSSCKGAWLRTSDNGQTVSALAPATLADLCEGACYNDARVEVEAAA
jgi:anaerobic selenocysteine-containing dehydrogenase